MTGVLLALLATAGLVSAGVNVAACLRIASRAERWVAGVLFSFVGLTFATQLVSAVGGIGRTGFLSVTLVLFAGSLLWRRRCRREPPSSELAELVTGERWLAAGAAAMTGLISVAWLWRGLAQPVLVVSDGPIYHLPFAVRWMQDGALSRSWTPFGELAATYFPGNGEIWLCWLLTLVGDDRLAKVGQWSFLLPTGAALYALARRAGGGPSSSYWPPLCWAACPLTYISSVKPDVDLPMTFLLVAGVLFLDVARRPADGPARRAPLIVAALAFGAAAGTKSIGLLYSFVPFMFVAWLARRDWRHAAACATAALVAGGYWYLRNWWETGNPLYPLRLSAAGVTLFDGWYGADDMRATSGYHAPVFDPHLAWEILSVVAHPALWCALALSAIVGVSAVLLSAGRARRGSVAVCLGFALLWAGSFWFVQPYNTQQRFLLPALAAAFVPLGLLRGSLHLTPAILLAAASIRDLRALASLDARFVGAAAIVVLTAALMTSASRRTSPWALSVTAVAAVLLAPTVGFRRSEEPGTLFYSTRDFGERLFPAWARLQRSIDATAPGRSAVVGYAGTNLPYYLAGPSLTNKVRYVNVQGEADWLPHDHFRTSRRPTDAGVKESAFPHWHRDRPDKEAWLRNLDALGVDHFLVARENFHGRPDAPAGLPPFPIEYEWLAVMPERFERLGPPAAADGQEPWGIAFRVRPALHRP